MMHSQTHRQNPHLSDSESHSDFLDSSNFEREWNDVQFGGQQYTVNVSVNSFDEKYEDPRNISATKEKDHEFSTSSSYVLLIETELQRTGQRWTGEFTSLYLEEISQKVGSFKRFATFLKMLYSALSRESDNVVLEFLTYEELEEIKARKMQYSNSGSPVLRKVATVDAAGRKRISQQKRYFILTYRGEFDMVHYPLPLPFEEQPSSAALQRMNKRLRKKLAERLDGITLSERERELRQQVSSLRQENTELRHRLRQVESRVAKQASATVSAWTSPNPSIAPSLSAAPTVEAELQTSNIKLRRQLESVRKELHSVNFLLERERAETAKRRLKSSGSPSGRERSTSRSNSIEVKGNSRNISELKRRVVDLERQLKLERYSKDRLDSVDQHNHRSHLFHAVPPSKVSGLTRRSFSADTSTTRLSKHSYQKPPRYATPTLTGSRSSSASRRLRTPSPSNSTLVPASGAWSSSLGGRFDPTAYREQQLQRRQVASSNRERAWGAGVGSKNTRTESGYASANSQSSGGSSSRRSQRSGQHSVGSEASNGSGKGKGKSVSQRRKKLLPRKVRSPFATSANDPSVAVDGEVEQSSLQLLKKTLLSDNSRSRFRKSVEQVDNIPTRDFHSGNQKDVFKRNPNDSEDDERIRQRGFSSSKIVQNKTTGRLPMKDTYDIETISQDSRSSAVLRNARQVVDSGLGNSVEDMRLSSSSYKSAVREEGSSELKEGINDVMKSADSLLGAQSVSSDQSNNSSNKAKTGMNDISEIDRRIQALQAYLDNARSGILNTVESRSGDRS